MRDRVAFSQRKFEALPVEIETSGFQDFLSGSIGHLHYLHKNYRNPPKIRILGSNGLIYSVPEKDHPAGCTPDSYHPVLEKDLPESQI